MRLIPYDKDVLLAVIEQYNADLWPAHLVALMLATLAILLTMRPRVQGGRFIAAILAAAWIWSGLVYLNNHYAELNWAGRFYAIALGLQAVWLLWIGALRDRLAFGTSRAPSAWVGLAAALFALAVYPLIDIATGAPWQQAQIVGLMPDPTALFTLGLLMTCAPRLPWISVAIPVAWLLWSGTWAWLMEAPERSVLAIFAAAAVVLGIALRRRSGAAAQDEEAENA